MNLLDLSLYIYQCYPSLVLPLRIQDTKACTQAFAMSARGIRKFFTSRSLSSTPSFTGALPPGRSLKPPAWMMVYFILLFLPGLDEDITWYKLCMLYIYGNMDPINIPPMLAYIYHTWILWVMNKNEIWLYIDQIMGKWMEHGWKIDGTWIWKSVNYKVAALFASNLFGKMKENWQGEIIYSFCRRKTEYRKRIGQKLLGKIIGVGNSWINIWWRFCCGICGCILVTLKSRIDIKPFSWFN